MKNILHIALSFACATSTLTMAMEEKKDSEQVEAVDTDSESVFQQLKKAIENQDFCTIRQKIDELPERAQTSLTESTNMRTITKYDWQNTPWSKFIRGEIYFSTEVTITKFLTNPLLMAIEHDPSHHTLQTLIEDEKKRAPSKLDLNKKLVTRRIAKADGSYTILNEQERTTASLLGLAVARRHLSAVVTLLGHDVEFADTAREAHRKFIMKCQNFKIKYIDDPLFYGEYEAQGFLNKLSTLQSILLLFETHALKKHQPLNFEPGYLLLLDDIKKLHAGQKRTQSCIIS